MKKQDSEKAVSESLMEPDNPDYSSESRGLSSENDRLPSLEDMEKLAKIAQAENRIEKATRGKTSKDKSASAAFKSQQRTMNAMRSFYSQVSERNKRAGYKERIFTDDKAPELVEDCGQYIEFCMGTGIIPTWHLLAVWLDVTPQTLYAEESLSSKCSHVLKKFKTTIFTILEQSTLQREGNPAAGIFFLKSLWGLSDQQPVDVNVHMEGQRQLSDTEVQNVIELTPEEIHETT